jgi:hypothetical protein
MDAIPKKLFLFRVKAIFQVLQIDEVLRWK